MSQGEVESELGISLRQLQRELHKGLDAVSAVLWEKRGKEVPRLLETQELQEELERWEISRQSCQVQTLVDDTLWMLKPLLEEHGVTMEVDLPATLLPVFLDATLTRQTLFQVLRALVRSSPPGRIQLDAIEEKDQTKIVLRSAAHIAKEYEEDWQRAQAICQQQGIKLEALPAGNATEIVVVLPRASQRRVLVIDDNAAIHQLLERYLAPQHYEIIHARNGQEALQFAGERLPDAITLDVMMPNVDGWQVLRGLASNPATVHIPVIICSVLKEPELAFSLGAKAYLKKPVDRLELIATLARVLSSAGPAMAESRSAPADN
jgi:CheY-like chemotaxis protein